MCDGAITDTCHKAVHLKGTWSGYSTVIVSAANCTELTVQRLRTSQVGVDCHVFQSKHQTTHCIAVLWWDKNEDYKNTPPTSPQCSSLPLSPLRCNMECFMCTLEPTAVRLCNCFCPNSSSVDGVVHVIFLLFGLRWFVLSSCCFSCLFAAAPAQCPHGNHGIIKVSSYLMRVWCAVPRFSSLKARLCFCDATNKEVGWGHIWCPRSIFPDPCQSVVRGFMMK